MKKIIVGIMALMLAFIMVSRSDNAEKHTNSTVGEMEEKSSSVEIIPDSYHTYVVDFNSHNVCVAFWVPENWSVKKREIKDGEYPRFLSLDESFIEVYDILDENDNNLGAIGFENYTLNTDSEDNLMDIYGSVALPNMYNFALDKENYNVVDSNETGETAITKVYHSPSLVHSSGGLGDAVYGDGILSYNKECQLFVAVEFKEAIFNDDVLSDLAGGIQIDWITGM